MTPSVEWDLKDCEKESTGGGGREGETITPEGLQVPGTRGRDVGHTQMPNTKQACSQRSSHTLRSSHACQDTTNLPQSPCCARWHGLLSSSPPLSPTGLREQPSVWKNSLWPRASGVTLSRGRRHGLCSLVNTAFTLSCGWAPLPLHAAPLKTR